MATCRRLALLASWSGRSADAIDAAVWRSGFEDDAERGAISGDEYLKGFGERMGHPLAAAQWIEARKVAMEPDPTRKPLASWPAGRLQVAPHEILFFDDDEPLVLGAREAGLTACRFGSAAGVRAALAAHGLT